MSRNGSVSKKSSDIDLTGVRTYEGLMSTLQQRVDPFGVTTSILNAQVAWMMHPQELSREISGMSGDVLALQTHVMRRAFGLPSEDVIKPIRCGAKRRPGTSSRSPIWPSLAGLRTCSLKRLAFPTRSAGERLSG